MNLYKFSVDHGSLVTPSQAEVRLSTVRLGSMARDIA